MRDLAVRLVARCYLPVVALTSAPACAPAPLPAPRESRAVDPSSGAGSPGLAPISGVLGTASSADASLNPLDAQRTPLPLATCVAALQTQRQVRGGVRVSQIVAHPSAFIGRRVQVTGILSTLAGTVDGMLSEASEQGNIVRIVVMPPPASVAECSGEACVTLEGSVAVDDAGPLRSDGEPIQLLDAVILAGAQSCKPLRRFSGIDREAAAAVLRRVAAEATQCRADGGPTGDGHVTVTFQGDAGVTWARVDRPPYLDSGGGACVERLFQAAHVPPFAGMHRMGTHFSIP